MHASTHSTSNLPCACFYAFHCRLFPAHASTHFTVYFPCTCVYVLHCVLALCMPQCNSLSPSLRMPLCSSLSTLRMPLRIRCLLMHLRTSLCTCPMHASMHFAVHFPCACLYASHCLHSLCMHVRTSLCTCPFALSPCSRGCRDVLRVLLLCLKIRTYFAHYFCT